MKWYKRPSSVVFGMILILSLLPYLNHAMADVQNATRISDLKGTGETLTHFLQRLPSSFEAQIFYAVVLFGLVGMLANYAVKWMKREIGGSLIKYLFFSNVRGTMLSLFTTIGVGIGAITAGVFETTSGEFVGWFNVMWVSLSNGFMWDATMNQGDRPVWTEAQRAEAKQP